MSECEHTPLYTHDSVGRNLEVPCPWCISDAYIRLREKLAAYRKACDYALAEDLEYTEEMGERHEAMFAELDAQEKGNG